MKRETLKELGLTGDQINAVMSEYGNSVNDLKTQLTTVEGERDQFKAQVETSQSETESKLAEQHKELAIQFAMKGLESRDNELVLGLLDKEQINLVDGELQGFSEQIEGLKTNKGFLFEQEPPKEEQTTPHIVIGGNPSGGSVATPTAFDDVKNKYN